MPRGRPPRASIHERLQFEVGELRRRLGGPVRLVPLEALADRRFSTEALRKAAARGRLRAVRTTAGAWRSSKQWVDEYGESLYASIKGGRTADRPDATGDDGT